MGLNVNHPKYDEFMTKYEALRKEDERRAREIPLNYGKDNLETSKLHKWYSREVLKLMEEYKECYTED